MVALVGGWVGGGRGGAGARSGREHTPKVRVRAATAALARWAVFFVFPTFMSAIRAIKSVILFKRGSIADKQVRAWLGVRL